MTDKGTPFTSCKTKTHPRLKRIDVYRTLRGILQTAARLILTMSMTWELLITPFHRYTERTEASVTQPVSDRRDSKPGRNLHRAHALNCCATLLHSLTVPTLVMTADFVGTLPTEVTSSLLRAEGGVQGLQARFLAVNLRN